SGAVPSSETAAAGIPRCGTRAGWDGDVTAGAVPASIRATIDCGMVKLLLPTQYSTRPSYCFTQSAAMRSPFLSTIVSAPPPQTVQNRPSLGTPAPAAAHKTAKQQNVIII